MTNTTLASILLLFAGLGVIIFILALNRREERDATNYLLLLCASNIIWSVLNALFYIIPNEKTALLVFDIRLVFVCYSSIFTYLFALKSVRHMSVSLNFRIFLYTIPVITGILVLFDSQLHMVRTNIYVEIVDGIRTVVNTNGLWFWIHTFVCYVCILLTAILLVKQYFRLPEGYRSSIAIMIIGLLLSGLATLVSVLSLAPYSFDIAPIVVQITQATFFFSLYHSHSLDILFTSRDAIFENAANAIFILNNEMQIMDYNKKANEMSRGFGPGVLYNTDYSDFIKRWAEHYSGRYFKEDPSIITIYQNGEDKNYQIQTTPFYSKSNKEIGSYVEIKNITPMMTLIHKLQDSAYRDHLTGLLNRRSFANKMLEFDTQENLPLGLMVGDVNKLKLVNDTYGHAVGDLLLQAITSQLKATPPKGAMWFRIGGDEFVCMVPNTTPEEMEDYLGRLKDIDGNLHEPRFKGAGIALAYKIKTDMEQDLHDIFAQADAAMYRGKLDRRK